MDLTLLGVVKNGIGGIFLFGNFERKMPPIPRGVHENLKKNLLFSFAVI